MTRTTIRPMIAGLAAVAAAAPLTFAQPAFAGYWSLSGTPSGSYSGSNGGSGLSTSKGQSSVSFSDFGEGGPVSGKFTYTGTVKWVPNGSLQSDPAPATFTLTETSSASGTILYASQSDTTSASDGLGDPGVTTYTSNSEPVTLKTVSSGSRTTVVSVAAGGSYSFTRTLTTYSSGPEVDQGYVSYSASVK